MAGFLPSRYLYRGQVGIVQSLTSSVEPQQQSRHLALIALMGVNGDVGIEVMTVSLAFMLSFTHQDAQAHDGHRGNDNYG